MVDLGKISLDAHGKGLKKAFWDEVFWGKGGSPTPQKPYQRIAGCRSNGASYFKSKVKPSINIDFYCRFSVQSSAPSGYGNVFGSRYGSSNGEYQFGGYSYGTINKGGGRYAGNFPLLNTWYEVSVYGNVLTVNGVSKTINIGSYFNPYEFVIFGISQGTLVTQLGVVTIDELIFYENGVTLEHYQAVRLLEDVEGGVAGETGMWELKENVFKGSVTSTKFIPIEYDYPEWVYEMGTPIYGVRTTGASWFTSNFELGYTGKTVIKTIADDNASTRGIYGWYNSADTSRVAIGIANGKWFAGKDNTNYGPTTVVGEPVTLTMDRDSNIFTVNGSTVELTPVSSDVVHKTFLGHRSDTTGGVFSGAYVGIIQLWQEYATDGTLLKDSIPLIHKDGTVGMVDLVTRNFEGSATSTPFEAITNEAVATSLMSLGVTPTSDFDTNVKLLNDMGVSI